jgi:hypothetical protein
MPKYTVTGFWTYKGLLEIEADNKAMALEVALQELPDIDSLERIETYIESAELIPE